MLSKCIEQFPYYQVFSELFLPKRPKNALFGHLSGGEVCFC